MLQNTLDLSVIIIYLIFPLFLNWTIEIGGSASICCIFLNEKFAIISRIYLLLLWKIKMLVYWGESYVSSSKTRNQFVTFDTTIRDVINITQFIKRFRYDIERGLGGVILSVLTNRLWFSDKLIQLYKFLIISTCVSLLQQQF